MTRGRRAIRQLLRKILTDNRQPVISGNRSSYRRALKGGIEARSYACKRATDYLSQLRVAPDTKPFPPSLRQTVAELRKQGADVRLNAATRMLAIERLLLLEGVDVPRQDDATERFICEQCGIAAPQKPDSATTTDVRAAARRQALTDIQECFVTDRANGAFKSLGDIVLRLPEQEAPAAPKVGNNTAALEEALAVLRGGKK